MKNTINIGTQIDIQDLLQSRCLIQANSGGGKSVLARVLIENTFGLVPFIVMDIEGEYYTLKEKFGDLLVIGGQHADIPISLQSVKLLPKEIIANRLSVVIDLSDLQMNDRILYAKHFIETMMDLNKDYWVNYLVFIEEAHKLCGEQDKQASATAVKDLMSRGRKRGYCGILLTQRISKLHKDAAAECNNKFIGRTFLDIDLDRSAKELAFSDSSKKNQLRSLAPGTFYAFGTSIEPHEVHEVKILLPQTKIPKAGVSLDIKPKAPTEKIKLMLAKLNDLPKENVQNKIEAISDADKTVIQRLQYENNALRNDVKNIESKYGQVIKNIQEYNRLMKEIQLLTEKSPALVIELNISQATSKPVSESFVSHNQEFTEKVYQKSNNSSSVVSGGAMRMLKAAAMFPTGITKMRMAALARLSHSSGSFGTYLSTLKKNGYLLGEGNNFCITDHGMQAAGDVEPLPTDPFELIEMWCEVIGSQSGAARMLRILGNRYPNDLTKEALGDLSGMSHSSGSFGTYLSTLKRNGLIEQSGKSIKAADNLFK